MLRVLHWPLKSFGNFSITAIGLIGVGFWSYSFYSESKFNQPIIAESIKLLGKHPQIKELAGYPLSYSFALGNRFVEKEGQNYFSFSVKGPKTSTNVQMTTTTLPAGEVYNYGTKSEKICKLEEQIKKQEEQGKSLQGQISKSNGKKQKDLQLQKLAHNNKLRALQDQLVEAKYQQLQRKKKYFVPSKQTYTIASNPKSKDSNQPIPKEQLLWGINDLVITLPNRTKMIVLPEAKKSLNQKYQALKKNDLPDTPTLGLIYKQVSIDISQFSKDQVEEYGKQKISFMYSRYGSYRLFTFILFIGGVVGLITYKRNNVLLSIKGSILEMEARKKLTQNPQLIKFMKNQAKQLDIEIIIGGGKIGNQFDIVFYLKNFRNGKVLMKGTYSPQLNSYHFNKMQLRYKDKQEYKVIDLLV